MKNPLAGRGDRDVRSLEHDLAAYAAGVAAVDHVRTRCRHEEVDLQVQEGVALHPAARG